MRIQKIKGAVTFIKAIKSLKEQAENLQNELVEMVHFGDDEGYEEEIEELNATIEFVEAIEIHDDLK